MSIIDPYLVWPNGDLDNLALTDSLVQDAIDRGDKEIKAYVKMDARFGASIVYLKEKYNIRISSQRGHRFGQLVIFVRNESRTEDNG
jgi:hypothetical protein